jgi:hypothetical protein
MVAASMYATGTWSDQPECVPPTVRTLCVKLNDLCADGEREELIGPHLFTPMGRDASKESEQARAYLCADRAVRVFAPMALDAAGLPAEAAKMRACAPITDTASAGAARASACAAADAACAARASAAADAAWAARTSACAARASAGAARASACAAADAACAARASAAADAARAAAWAADAADASACASAQTKKALLQLILDCCAIGEQPKNHLDGERVARVMRDVCMVGGTGCGEELS